MAFCTARLDATYTYRDTAGLEHEIPLVAYDRTLLYSKPERSWNLPSDEYELVGRDWSEAAPKGNASLSISFHIAISRDSYPEAEAAARRLEYQLNLHRSGSLHLREAFLKNIPLLESRWDALVSNALADPCTSEDAPAIPGGHAQIKIDFRITNPSF